ncbi:MAG: hypothetical protein ABIO79_06270 [Ferruginibacter sp.]
MNKVLFRTLILILHTLLNFFIVSYVMDYDLTGSWLRITLFVLLLLVLLYFFVLHIIAYSKLVKPK